MTLDRLRVHLTLWYAVTFAIIILLLGAGLFVAIETQVSRRIDASLVAATAAVVRATHDLEVERAAGGAADAVEELHIPDRALYLSRAPGGRTSCACTPSVSPGAPALRMSPSPSQSVRRSASNTPR